MKGISPEEKQLFIWLGIAAIVQVALFVVVVVFDKII